MEYSPPLIKSHQALEIQEDIALSAFVVEREKSWDNSKALTHDAVWS